MASEVIVAAEVTGETARTFGEKLTEAFWDNALLPFFTNWPPDADAAGQIVVLFGLLGAVVWIVLLVLLVGPWRSRTREGSPREIPEGAVAWTVQRNSWWVSYYYWFWNTYPRDVCSYFWQSIIMPFMTILGMIALLGFILPVLRLIYGILFEAIPWLISHLPEAGMWVVEIFVSASSLPLTYYIIGGIAAVVLFILFFFSRPGKFLLVWLRAKKEKVCPLIRVQ